MYDSRVKGYLPSFVDTDRISKKRDSRGIWEDGDNSASEWISINRELESYFREHHRNIEAYNW